VKREPESFLVEGFRETSVDALLFSVQMREGGVMMVAGGEHGWIDFWVDVDS
jgi:hypothetical protein